MWNEEERSFSSIADDIASGIDGAIDEYRVHAGVGATRREALSADGACRILHLASGAPVEDQVVEHIRATVERHRTGPQQYAWFALRKAKNSGNILVSRSVRIGSEEAVSTGLSLQQQAVAQAVGVLPRMYDMMERLVIKSMDAAVGSREHELLALVQLAHAAGAAEAGDEAARWQALQEVATQVGPSLASAVGQWIAGMQGRAATPAGGGSPDTWTTERAAEWLSRLPADVQAEIIAEIRRGAA